MRLQQLKRSLLFTMLLGALFGVLVGAGGAAYAQETVGQLLQDDAAINNAVQPDDVGTKKAIAKNSKDFYARHKSLKKKLPVKKPPVKEAVQADDLMNAMRENIDPNAQPAAPVVVPAPEKEQVEETKRPLFSPGKKAIIKPIPVDKLAAPDSKKPAAPVADALPEMLPPLHEAPDAKPSDVKQDAKETIKEKEEKHEAAVTVAPAKKDDMKAGAPLLTELADAPDGAVNVPNAMAKKPIEAPKAAPVPENAPDNGEFSKARPLFSSLNDKRVRPGISKISNAPLQAYTTPEPNAAPVQPTSREPMIKPVPSPEHITVPTGSAAKSIWEAPKPDMDKGQVIFSQAADGTAPTIVSPVAAPVISSEQKEIVEAPAIVLPTPVATQVTSERIMPGGYVAPSTGPVINGSCGTSHGMGVTVPPMDNLCVSGTPTSVIGGGPFMWSCQGVNGGSVVNCIASLQINGICGSANGVAVEKTPLANLCHSGNASPVSGTGPFIWTCQGAGSGITSTCIAPQLVVKAPEPPA